MSGFKLVGIAGSFNRPSKTLALVRHVADRASIRYGFASKTYDLNDVGPSLGRALWRKDLDEQARHVVDEIVQADALLGPALAKLPAGHAAYLTGHTFFPSLISAPFQHGLDIAFDFAIVACLVAAVASLLRGRRYVHEEQEAVVAAAEVESGDDLEGSEAGVLGVGDPAPVAGHLAQRG